MAKAKAAKVSAKAFFKLVFATLLFLSAISTSAGNYSREPISDEEISKTKQGCIADIDRSSLIEKENCALKCLSPICYELIYESDPLEEGERDFIRSQEFRYCMRRSSVGLNLDQVKGAFDNDVTVRHTAFALPGSMRITK